MISRSSLSGLLLMAAKSALTADSLAAVATTEPSGETIALWTGGAPGGGRVKVQEAYFERATQGPLRAQRNAARTGSPDTFGVIGFSAGGHAVARFITEPSLTYSRHDSTDELPARVDFAVLMYPVIATTGAQAHAGSASQLLARGVSATALENYSPDRHVTPDTPPTLLVHAADDEAVPVGNSLQMFAALRQAGVRSELHVFDRGGHGFGLRAVAGKDVAAWPQLVQNWELNFSGCIFRGLRPTKENAAEAAVN